MRTVQLDKSAGGKKLRDWCNQEGIIKCELLPYAIRDATDDVVLDHGIKHNRLTVTFDKTMYVNSAEVLAGQNTAGVLVLRSDDGSLQQISTKTAPKILESFKSDFPDWHKVPWQNSVVELTPSLVMVYQTTAAPPVLVGALSRSESTWPAELARLLNENAKMINLRGIADER